MGLRNANPTIFFYYNPNSKEKTGKRIKQSYIAIIKRQKRLLYSQKTFSQTTIVKKLIETIKLIPKHP